MLPSPQSKEFVAYEFQLKVSGFSPRDAQIATTIMLSNGALQPKTDAQRAMIQRAWSIIARTEVNRRDILGRKRWNQQANGKFEP